MTKSTETCQRGVRSHRAPPARSGTEICRIRLITLLRFKHTKRAGLRPLSPTTSPHFYRVSLLFGTPGIAHPLLRVCISVFLHFDVVVHIIHFLLIWDRLGFVARSYRAPFLWGLGRVSRAGCTVRQLYQGCHVRPPLLVYRHDLGY